MSRGSRVIVEANCAEQPAQDGSAQDDEPPSSFGIAQDRAERGDEGGAQLQILALTQPQIEALLAPEIRATDDFASPSSPKTWHRKPQKTSK